ncbi:MAG TPA: OmpH family outer membrane protein [Planctomycetota bacterium]|nr:OmpH family outer membrane protein [Planctomycetota bacterium]
MSKCVLALCTLLLSGAALAAGAADRGGQKLAVVNVSYIFENYKKVPEVQRSIDARYDPEKKVLQQKSEDLVKRRRELEQNFSAQQQDERVFDAVQKLRKDTFLFERDMARINYEIQKAYTKEMRDVLTDIRVGIRAVAEKGGFSLVLRSPNADDPEVDEKAAQDPAAGDRKTMLEMISPKTVAQLVERFNRNPVLFGAQTVDITEEVLLKLNNDYARRMGVDAKPQK